MRRIFEVADKKFHAELRKSEGWWRVRCVEEKGAISQGKTVKSALRNIQEALTLILEAENKIVWDSKSRSWIYVAVEDNPKLRKLVRESVRVG